MLAAAVLCNEPLKMNYCVEVGELRGGGRGEGDNLSWCVRRML